jgi:hypothetical protein
MIFGIVQNTTEKSEGTKIHVKHGVIKSGRFTLPAGVLDVLRHKAMETSKAMERMSAR